MLHVVLRCSSLSTAKPQLPGLNPVQFEAAICLEGCCTQLEQLLLHGGPAPSHTKQVAIVVCTSRRSWVDERSYLQRGKSAVVTKLEALQVAQAAQEVDAARIVCRRQQLVCASSVWSALCAVMLLNDFNVLTVWPADLKCYVLHL